VFGARMPTIAIIGADGHVGRHAVARAQGAGLTVRPAGPEDDVEAVISGADGVVHLAGTLQATGPNTYHAANVATVERTIAAAVTAGIGRIVYLSYVGADPDARNGYLRSKGRAEELLRSCPVEAVILRATFIFGPPEDPGPSIEPFIQHEGRPVSVIGSGSQRYQPVYVEDVAGALLRALGSDVAPGIYTLAGPDILAVDELVTLVNGHAVRERHLAGLAARVAAAVAPSLTQAMVGVLGADSLPDAPPAWPSFRIDPVSMGEIYR
jgi:uncharacterized protein YbjT (DUF2867 family)